MRGHSPASRFGKRRDNRPSFQVPLDSETTTPRGRLFLNRNPIERALDGAGVLQAEKTTDAGGVKNSMKDSGHEQVFRH